MSKKEVEKTVSTDELKKLLDSAGELGHPLTGQIKRDGDTFEDEELGAEWDASFDSTKELIEKVNKGTVE